MKRLSILIGLMMVFFFGTQISMAAETRYPTRPVEITVAAAPGGGTDLGARAIAAKLKEYFGQEFVIINKSGGHRVTLTLIAKARPDGYSLGGVTDSSIVLSPHVEKINYSPLDYTFFCQYGKLDFGVYVLPDSPFKTFKDMVEYARANPKKLTIGITEVNSGNHIALMALCQMEKISVNYIPFMGASPTTMALLGGHVMVASSATSGFARQVQSKTVRLLAMMSDERLDEFPDAPTLKELGYPSLVFQSWYAMIGHKDLPPEIVKKLGDGCRKAMESPAFINLSKEIASYVKKPLFGEELKKAFAQRLENNGKIIKGLGLKISEGGK
ncbi:MAG: tripartite tricarboxylate transporter substrate binding protein [Thermodesulfobacteriota bacterium]